MASIRINKYLASLGIASRRRVDELVLQERVRINSKLAKEGDKIDPDLDKIFIDSIEVKTKPKDEKIYIILNKPVGYVTTTAKFANQKNILDLVDISQRIFPIGRLDKDTTGLLLLTNDGDLTYVLTHPKFEKDKTYVVTHTGATSVQLKKLSQGVLLGGVFTLPAKVNIINNTSFSITIHEGKNRQIRRMCEKVGLILTHLHRSNFHGLSLGQLPEGKWRYLNKSEIILLQR